MVKHLAVIPARGGSKRLPRKNIMPLGGQPMLTWTVEAALEAKVFDRVLVSTDDEEIAAVARSAGAEVPFLRSSNADDHASVSDAVLVALAEAEDHWGETYETVSQLMPNCPLRGADVIKRGMAYFDENEHLFQISAFRFGWMNPWWAFRLGEQGQPEKLFAGKETARSQDLPSLFAPTGAFWIAERNAFVQNRSFYGPGWRSFELDWTSAIDIDDKDDFTMAEMAIALRDRQK